MQSPASSKQVLLIELTISWEECTGEANERKGSKYQELVDQCQRRGCKELCMTIEKGCRGIVGYSLHRASGLLGRTKKEQSEWEDSTSDKGRSGNNICKVLHGIMVL